MVLMFAIGHVLRSVMSARKVDFDTLDDEIPRQFPKTGYVSDKRLITVVFDP